MTSILSGVVASGKTGHLSNPIVGSFDALATVTLTSTAASVTFSGIPSTYTHLQVRALSHRTGGTADDNTNMQFNADSGSNYAWHQLYGDGSSAAAGSATSTTLIRAIPDLTSSTGFGVGIIDVLDYANTSKLKTVRIFAGYDNNGGGYAILRSGLWFKAGTGVTSDAINSITFTPNSGSFTANTSFSLYGVR